MSRHRWLPRVKLALPCLITMLLVTLPTLVYADKLTDRLGELEDTINSCAPTIPGQTISAEVSGQDLTLHIGGGGLDRVKDVDIPLDELSHGGFNGMGAVIFVCAHAGCIKFSEHSDNFPQTNRSYSRTRYTLFECSFEDAKGIAPLVHYAVQCLYKGAC